MLITSKPLSKTFLTASQSLPHHAGLTPRDTIHSVTPVVLTKVIFAIVDEIVLNLQIHVQIQ